MMTTFTATNAFTLSAALTDAVGGDRIVLAGGDYGSLNITGLTFSSDVTITSADPAAPAVFTSFDLINTGHIVLDGLLIDYVFQTGDNSWKIISHVTDSSNITIRNCVIDGAEVGGTGTGKSLQVLNSTNVVIEYNEFRKWWKTLTIKHSANVALLHNNVHNSRSDGFNVIGVAGIVISYNWFHDFLLLGDSGDHPDMVQFWTEVDYPISSNITISDNFFDAGAGGLTQSIFFGNASSVKDVTSFDWHSFKNVVIENNVIHNAHTAGISLEAVNVGVINNNTLLYNAAADDPAKLGGGIPRIKMVDESIGLTINNNIIGPVWNWSDTENHSGWTVLNTLIADLGDYDALFVNATVGLMLADLRAVAGGVVELGGYGAAMTRADIPMDAGPGTVAPPAPPPEPDTCEEDLAAALVALNVAETALTNMTALWGAAVAALVSMTVERDGALLLLADAATDLSSTQAQLVDALATIEAVRVAIG